MTDRLTTDDSSNLSIAWARAFLEVMSNGTKELSPLVVSVDAFAEEDPVESSDIRHSLDSFLTKRRRPNCHTVANTIFPLSLWNSQRPADHLFARFDHAWPQLKKCRDNRRGTYFRRLTSYQPKGVKKPTNQLSHIIETYKRGNHRRSALQATIFDPTLDHNNCRQLGFPCLHQVAFIPGDDGLTVVGYYATQYLFERAYGNYLGLCRLGKFMASQMQLKLVKMICIASIAQRGKLSKLRLRPLETEITKLVG